MKGKPNNTSPSSCLSRYFGRYLFDRWIAKWKIRENRPLRNSWEFYAHNASGENTVVNVHRKLVPVDATAINEILDLPNDAVSIYELMEALEDIDYNSIKDALCRPETEWNIIEKNQGTINRPNLLLEAKLWNTIVKRNLMPTSHNQTVDRKRLVLIHSIIFSTKFNVGEVIARELSEAYWNDKGILAFPCLISALCRQRPVPTFSSDEYILFYTGYERKHYMKKMDVSDVIPIQVFMPTPAQSENTEPSAPTVHLEELAGSAPTTLPARHQGSPSVASAAPAPAHVPPADVAEPQGSGNEKSLLPGSSKRTTPQNQLQIHLPQLILLPRHHLPKDRGATM
ncbi:hypothetical protein V6N11_012618 [Hibiscus sabdariffa]|uniref:Putative plant transposon protein domain-containing protein n=1 Tax=Hibiscus sabdariffa TaxID=183260 RepID=A0ABR2QC36_9ROSI